MSTKICSPKILATRPHTKKWHRLRRRGIGGSEAAAALGLSVWQTARELYHRKRGELPPIADNEAMRMGRELEAVVLKEFTRRTGIGISRYPMPLYQHAEFPWMLGTPDAEADGGELVEVKTTSFRNDDLGLEETDNVPLDWLMQCQQYLDVLGGDLCHVAVLIDGRTFRHYSVERNVRLIDHLRQAEAELWERIQTGDPPATDWEHPSTPQLIRDLHDGRLNGETVTLSAAVVEAWGYHEWCKAEIKKLLAESEAAKAKCLDELGTASAGLLGNGELLKRIWTPEKEIAAHTRRGFVQTRKIKAKPRLG